MKSKISFLTLFLVLVLFLKAQNNFVPLTGLVGYFKLDGNANDSSGFNNHGTVNASPAVSNRFGQASSASYFNGSSSYMLIPTSASLQPNTAVSISAWIKPEQTTLPATVVSKRFSVASNPLNSYAITTSPDTPISNKWSFALSKGLTGTEKLLTAKNFQPFGVWMFIATTYDGSLMKIYINGVLDTGMAFTGNLGYSAMGLGIGYSGNGVNDYFKGAIDEVTIHNRALTESEVNAMYHGTVGISDIETIRHTNHIYPNPVNDVLVLDFDATQTRNISITDIAGKQVIEQPVAKQISTTNLHPGIYFIHFISSDQTKQQTFRFVKE